MQSQKGGQAMKMDRVMIQLPKEIKAKLDSLRRQGTTASGYIRGLLIRELEQVPSERKGR